MAKYAHITQAYEKTDDVSGFRSIVIDGMLHPRVILNHIPKWPMVVNLIGAICCLGLSSYYHTCRCISEGLFHRLLCMDKSGVALLIAGSTAPSVTYLYACESVAGPRNLILTLIFVLAALTYAASFNSTWLGPYLFVAMGLTAGAPFYSIGLFDQDDLLSNRSDYYFNYMFGGAIYILGAVILVLKVPERFVPIKFDLIGASHNIWHFAVLTGCVWHFVTGVRMYEQRKEFICPIKIPARFDMVMP